MNFSPKYVHTNLIARDWRALARFYIDLFGCVPVPPERDFRGPEIEAGTAIPGTHLTGMHLRLPGWGENGPTLELFHYDELDEHGPGVLNRPGFGHLAFQVSDVTAAQGAVLSAGGKAVGAVSTLHLPNGTAVTMCYVTDPEGNILELQRWN